MLEYIIIYRNILLHTMIVPTSSGVTGVDNSWHRLEELETEIDRLYTAKACGLFLPKY